MIDKNELANFDAMLFDLVKWIKDTRNKITAIVKDGFKPFYKDAIIAVNYPVLEDTLLGANDCCTDIKNAFTRKFSDCLKSSETPEISYIRIYPDLFGSNCPKSDEQCLCIDVESNVSDKDDMTIWNWDRIIVPFSELNETTTFEQVFKKYSVKYLKAKNSIKETLSIFSGDVKESFDMTKRNNYINISHSPEDLKNAIEEVLKEYYNTDLERKLEESEGYR